MSTQKKIQGIDLRVHMTIMIGLTEHLITELNPVRSFTKNGFHTQTGKTLVTVLNDDEKVSFIVENDHEYEVRESSFPQDQ